MAVVWLAFILAGLAGFEFLVTAVSTTDVRHVVVDDGPIELVQLALGLLTAGFLIDAGRVAPNIRDIAWIFALMALFASARELDHAFDGLGVPGSYRVVTFPLGLGALAVAVRARELLPDQIRAAFMTPATGLLAAGFFVVVVYAQIIGQKELWQGTLGVAYLRPVKDLVEESAELVGYFLLAWGAVTARLSWHRSSS